MPQSISGDLIVRGQRFAVVTSRYHESITRRLQSAAVSTLVHHGCGAGDIAEVWVPGAFELPVAAQALAGRDRYDAVIALGCVIRGETPHFEYICSAVSQQLAEVAVCTGIPVSFGVLTTDTVEQALARAGDGPNNKGAEAAVAAIEMTNLLDRISELQSS